MHQTIMGGKAGEKLTVGLLVQGCAGVEDGQRTHKLLKVDDVVALGVKGLEDLVHK